MNEFDSAFQQNSHQLIQTTDKSSALDVMERAGARFDVNYPPATYIQSDRMDGPDGVIETPQYGEGKHEGTELYKWVVREDTGDVLGLHSGTYPEIANYEFLGELAERMFPNSTTGCTVIGKGERIMLKQDITDKIDLGGDVIQPQVLWISSFNGTWATSVMDSVYRWFCANQIVTGNALFKCRHTENHNYTLEQRSYVLEESIKRARNFTTMAKIMKDQDYTDEQFKALTEQLVPKPLLLPGDKEIAERRWTLVHKKREHMINKWNEECEEWGHGTRWLAYNAVQGAEQHHINCGFKETEAAQEKALVKAIDGRTPLSTRALSLLSDG